MCSRERFTRVWNMSVRTRMLLCNKIMYLLHCMSISVHSNHLLKTLYVFQCSL